jgi:hypothetical protein
MLPVTLISSTLMASRSSMRRAAARARKAQQPLAVGLARPPAALDRGEFAGTGGDLDLGRAGGLPSLIKGGRTAIYERFPVHVKCSVVPLT